MEDLASKVDGDEINGAEWRQQPKEIQNLITDSGQDLNGGDLRQLAKATSIVVADKAAANAIPIIENGRKVFITSPDGGSFTMRTGLPIGTLNDNGGTLTGTQFTNGDGSSGLERDTDGVINSKWFENGIVASIEGIEINATSVKQYYNGILATETIIDGLEVNGRLNITHSGSSADIVNNTGELFIRPSAVGAPIFLQAVNTAGTNQTVFAGGVRGGSIETSVELYAANVIEAETIVGAFNVVNKLQIGGQDVTVGAVDSGGVGFRVLRIPN